MVYNLGKKISEFFTSVDMLDDVKNTYLTSVLLVQQM